MVVVVSCSNAGELMKRLVPHQLGKNVGETVLRSNVPKG
jgi:hypothetical protein